MHFNIIHTLLKYIRMHLVLLALYYNILGYFPILFTHFYNILGYILILFTPS